MKIIELRAENVKRLKAVAIKPTGNIVTIAGRNGQGKSSVLDAIMYALAGAKSHAAEVIRKGTEKASVTLDLGDFIVDWKKTPSGATVAVKSRDGARYPSPQAMLDKLYAGLCFDPLGFMRYEPAKQVETVKKMTGLDFGELNARRSALYERRTEVNVAGQQMKARVDAMPVPGPEVPNEPVSVEALLDEQAKIQAQKDANARVRGELAEAERAVAVAEQATRRADEVQTRMMQELERARVAFQEAALLEERARRALVERTERVMKLVEPDVSEVYRRIRSAQGTNDAVRAKKERAELEAKLAAKRAERDQLTKDIEAIDAEKAKRLAEAPMPIVGLGFNESGVTLQGLPLEQASAAEQLRVSMAMGLALNPKLKVVLIRDGSLLDKESLAIVAEMAAQVDAQVWLEKVADGDAGSAIVIEDGEVVGAEVAQAANS